MDLLLCFDDDFFESTETKRKPRAQPYNVKICERNWLFKPKIPSCIDDVDKQNITKFQADYWYRGGQYQEALDAYEQIQANPQVSSTTVEREIAESIARCHLKLGNVGQAAGLVHVMLKRQDNDTSLLFLLVKTCQLTGNIQEEMEYLKRCISLHSYNHWFWYSLALAFSRVSKYTNVCESNNMDGMTSNREHGDVSNQAENNVGLHVYCKCTHCKCLGDELALIDQHVLSNGQSYGESQEGFQKVQNTNKERLLHVNPDVLHGTNEIVELIQYSTIGSENRSPTENQTLPKNSCVCASESCGICSNKVLETQTPTRSDHHNISKQCNFNVKLTSSWRHKQHLQQTSNQNSRQDQLCLFAFFCLLRTRFLLQRAVWTSSSFAKDKLTKVMSEVNQKVDDSQLCKCGELKKCILKQVKSEDALVMSEAVDMHTLYQGAAEKHWI